MAAAARRVAAAAIRIVARTERSRRLQLSSSSDGGASHGTHFRNPSRDKAGRLRVVMA
jgi:hypothetical protein